MPKKNPKRCEKIVSLSAFFHFLPSFIVKYSGVFYFIKKIFTPKPL